MSPRRIVRGTAGPSTRSRANAARKARRLEPASGMVMIPEEDFVERDERDATPAPQAAAPDKRRKRSVVTAPGQCR